MATIIMDINRLKDELEVHRRNGKTIVLGNGAFDLLHVGHIRYIVGAKQQGDILVLAVNSDRSIQGNKGAGRPVYPLPERIEILAALRDVDYITSFDDATVDRFLEILRPHVHAKGTDYNSANLPEKETLRRLGIRLAVVGDPKIHSTSAVFSKIKAHP